MLDCSRTNTEGNVDEGGRRRAVCTDPCPFVLPPLHYQTCSLVKWNFNQASTYSCTSARREESRSTAAYRSCTLQIAVYQSSLGTNTYPQEQRVRLTCISIHAFLNVCSRQDSHRRCVICQILIAGLFYSFSAVWSCGLACTVVCPVR
jgi:hypothetical protein